MKASYPIWKITLFISLFITLLGNYSFWNGFLSRITLGEDYVLVIGFFIVIWFLTNFLLTLISFKLLFKPIAILLLMSSAFAAYFMDNYSVMIDRGMIDNVLGTDMHEAGELFSIRLLVTVILLGVVPSYFLYKKTIVYSPLFKGLIQRSFVAIISVLVISGTLYSNYQEISFFSRNNRELRHLINPVNYITSIRSLVSEKISEGEIIVKPIENDAYKTVSNNPQKKPSLVFLVLGETARSMNFSLNGYSRDTNPLLKKQNIINFEDVTSCGTATAVSVPCMFSKYTRDSYTQSKANSHENLLDVAKHAGYKVLWLDNNTGCQGTCERVNYKSLAQSESKKYCEGGNCFDEILLEDLQRVVDDTKENTLIILHQKGNHGPTYHKRYPEKFEVFQPSCKTNQLRSCTQEEIVNAYDNAILYTDYFISQSINFLKGNKAQYNTALVYMSDHGESLGENNLYLHGLPYFIAPEQQKKVPFMLWLSNDYQRSYGLDTSCISKKKTQKLSQDNLFSSMLGLLAIETQVRDDELDIFASCNAINLAKSH